MNLSQWKKLQMTNSNYRLHTEILELAKLTRTDSIRDLIDLSKERATRLVAKKQLK